MSVALSGCKVVGRELMMVILELHKLPRESFKVTIFWANYRANDFGLVGSEFRSHSKLFFMTVTFKC